MDSGAGLVSGVSSLAKPLGLLLTESKPRPHKQHCLDLAASSEGPGGDEY